MERLRPIPIQAPAIERSIMTEPRAEWLPEESLFALTKEQKEAVRKRDHYQCQFPGKHDCHGRREIHHVMPQGFAKEFNINPDYPENVLLICQASHDLIHSDIAEARHHYKPKGDSFSRVQELHRKALENREPYWNTEFDRAMTAVAVRNTQNAEREGWRFPRSKREFLDPFSGEIYKYQETKQ